MPAAFALLVVDLGAIWQAPFQMVGYRIRKCRKDERRSLPNFPPVSASRSCRKSRFPPATPPLCQIGDFCASAYIINPKPIHGPFRRDKTVKPVFPEDKPCIRSQRPKTQLLNLPHSRQLYYTPFCYPLSCYVDLSLAPPSTSTVPLTDSSEFEMPRSMCLGENGLVS